jgi:hypothetical protein
MKRMLAITALVLASVPAMAQYHGHRYNHHHHGYHRGGGWVTPLVLGGVVGYALTRPEPVIVQSPAVIMPPPPVIYSAPAPTCTVWTETQQPDGSVVRTRTCTQ